MISTSVSILILNGSFNNHYNVIDRVNRIKVQYQHSSHTCSYRFYLTARRNAGDKLTDGTGHKPHYRFVLMTVIVKWQQQKQ